MAEVGGLNVFGRRSCWSCGWGWLEDSVYAGGGVGDLEVGLDMVVRVECPWVDGSFMGSS